MTTTVLSEIIAAYSYGEQGLSFHLPFLGPFGSYSDEKWALEQADLNLNHSTTGQTV